MSRPKGYWRKQDFRRNYGITVEQYEKMLIEQNNLCSICDKEPSRRRLDVDHCHETNIVRGLLCENCNQGLGRFKDSPNLLRKAIAYLEKER